MVPPQFFSRVLLCRSTPEPSFRAPRGPHGAYGEMNAGRSVPLLSDAVRFASRRRVRAAMDVTGVPAVESAADALFRLKLMTRALTTGVDVEVLPMLAHQAVAATGAVGGVVAVVKHGRLRSVAAAGDPVSGMVEVAVSAALPWCDAVRTREPVVVTDAAEASLRYPELPVGDRCGSVALPLTFGSQVFGVLALRLAPGGTLGEQESALVSALVDAAAMVLELRRLATVGLRADRLAESDVFGVLTGEGPVVVEANDRFLAMVGRTRDELEQGAVDWVAMTPPEYRTRDEDGMRRLMAGDVFPVVAKEYLRPDGSRVPVLIGGVLLEAEPFRWMCVVLDRSDFRRLEGELERERAMLDAVVACAPLGVALWDTDLRFVRVNEAMAEMNGVPAADHAGRSIAEVVPDLADAATRLLGQVLASGEPLLDVEIVGETPAVLGLERTWIEQFFRIETPDGQVTGVGALAQEVTEQRRLAAARDDAVALLDAVLAAAPVGIAVFDPDVRFVRVNRALADINGVSVEDHLGRRLDEVVPGMAAQVELLRRVIDTGAAVTGLEVSGETPAQPGVRREWLVDYYPVSVGDRFVGAAATVVEVTERNRLHSQIQDLLVARHEDRFRQAVDAMLDSVMLLAPVRDGGRIVDFVVAYANAAVEEVAGRHPAELTGRRLLDLWPGARGGLFDRYAEVLHTGVPYAADGLVYADHVEGHEARIVVDLRAAALGDQVVVVWRSVADRVRRERQLDTYRRALEEAQRLAHLGNWSWGLATGVVTCSTEAARLFAQGLSGPLGLVDVIGTADLGDAADSEQARALALVAARRIERSAMLADGSPVTLQIRAEAVIVDGELVEVRGTVQDITRLRRAQQDRDRALARLAAEHALVEALQRSVLPAELPDLADVELVAHYAAASHSQIGGDWYDAFTLDDGRLVIMVGDVAGHGPAAAEVMVKLRNAGRMAAIIDPNPATVCDSLDRLLAHETSSLLATAAVVVVDPATGALTWSLAGHPPLVLWLPDGRTQLLDTGARTPLGFTPDTTVPVGRATITAGGGLVLYTDGLVERRGESIDAGIERLTSALARHPSGTAEQVRDRILDACIEGPTLDDLSLVALIRAPAPAVS
jgi:PAS domain-containing protein